MNDAQEPAPELGFDTTVPPGGYRWWYVDAISDDGAHALTLIAFIGSVFSPYYARARKRAGAREQDAPRAEDHCSVNLALYHPPRRWSMTERDRQALQAGPADLRIGPSRLHVQRTAQDSRQDQGPGRHPDAVHELIIDVDEITVPVPRRLRGRLTVALPGGPFAPVSLDPQACHVWQPIAPRARIAVTMENPALTWHGTAYVDGNRGSVPLESSFRSWEWSRSHPDDGSTIVQYDVIDRDGNHTEKTFSFPAAPSDDTEAGRRQGEPATVHTVPGDGSASAQIDGPAQRQTLGDTRWFRIPRATRTDADASITELHTLEDTPFYARSRFRTSILGQTCECLHESLLLNRFDSPLTRCMLPFRMPRRAGRLATTARSERPAGRLRTLYRRALP